MDISGLYRFSRVRIRVNLGALFVICLGEKCVAAPWTKPEQIQVEGFDKMPREFSAYIVGIRVCMT